MGRRFESCRERHIHIMIVSVTGTDAGLGKSIADYLEHAHTVLRFGKQHDLRDYSVRQTILTADFDVLISVAKPDFAQTQLVYECFEIHGTKKRVINIGSAVVYEKHWGDDVHMMRYHTQKQSLAHAVAQINHPNIAIVNPAHLYDPGEYDYAKLEQWCRNNIVI